MSADGTRMLRALLAILNAGLVELRPIERGRGARASEFIPINQPERAAEQAERLGRGCDLFFSAIPRMREGRTAGDVGLAPACWADLDSPEAVDALGKLEAPPSIVVATGSGENRHAYWLLDDPVPAEEVVELNRALAELLRADVRATDAARILRLPGTLNHKSSPPTPVRLLHLTDARYDIAALRQLVGRSAPEPAEGDPGAASSAVVQRVLAKLERVRVTSSGWTAACPAHDDAHPSLSIAQGDDGRCLLNCHAGCTADAVVEVLGMSMRDLFADAAPASGRPSDATRLVDLALGAGLEPLHDDQDAPFGSIVRDRHRETMALTAPAFSRWLRQLYYHDRGRVPAGHALNDAIHTLTGIACFDGPEVRVATRLAGDHRRLSLDLGDASWRAVAVTADGWEVLDEPDVRFQRPPTSLALPEPVRGGSLEQLRPFVNVADEDWKLLLGWLVAALNPAGPYPVLVLLGEQGTAKSTTAELVRSVFDPVVAGRRALPKTERDLMISAASSWALLLDNLTKVTQEQSNTLCRLATGGGFATRELYTDRGEVVFDLCRPVLITGIDVAGLGEDLRERSMILELPLIRPQDRREERDIRARFEAEHAEILGALLDAASCALRRRNHVAMDASPRMADAASWMTAAEPALNVPTGYIARAFLENQRDVSSTRLSEDPVARTLMGFLDGEQEFTGTHTDLYTELIRCLPSDVELEDLPRNPQQLSRRLKQIAPALRLAGYRIKYPRRGRGGARIIVLGDARDT